MTIPTLADVIQSHISQDNQSLYTAIPAYIVDVSNYTTKCTVDVRPSIERSFSDGQSLAYPVLYDVPVQFPAGGGALMSFPLQVGDDVLLVFSMRSIDELMLSSEGTVAPEDRRTHSLSDAYAIPCIFREPNVISPSATDVVIKFGDASISLKEDGSISNTTSSTYSITGAVDELVSLVNQLAQQVALITVSSFGAVPNNAVAISAIQAKIAAFVETP